MEATYFLIFQMFQALSQKDVSEFSEDAIPSEIEYDTGINGTRQPPSELLK